MKRNIRIKISEIYECQKKIIINRLVIRELEAEKKDVLSLRDENNELERKIIEFKESLNYRP